MILCQTSGLVQIFKRRSCHQQGQFNIVLRSAVIDMFDFFYKAINVTQNQFSVKFIYLLLIFQV